MKNTYRVTKIERISPFEEVVHFDRSITGYREARKVYKEIKANRFEKESD